MSIIRTLTNQLTIIALPLKEAKTTTVLNLVKVGSRYEQDHQKGLSHFLEHLMFKGTKKRPQAQIIAQELDALGASYNAFTGYEYTGYWVKVRNQHKYTALDIITDILLNSLLQDSDIEVERGAIEEELHLYLDMPTRQIYTEFQELLYGDTPLGRPIIGTLESIKKFTRPDFLDYIQQHYRPTNTVLILAGAVDTAFLDKAETILNKFESKSSAINQKKLVQLTQTKPQVKIVPKKTDQTHLMLGFHTPDIHQPSRYVAQIASTILGGYMSSRLFSEIREKRGLCYYIQAHSQHFDDTGLLNINTGIKSSKLSEVVGLIGQEIKKMKQSLVSDRELKIAKEHIKGQMTMEFESSDEIASIVGLHYISLNQLFNLEEELSRYEQVSKQEILTWMNQYALPEKTNLAIIGNLTQNALKPMQEILTKI